MLSDSPWVQAIGVRRGSGADVEALRKKAQAVSARVAYSPLWTELFAGLLDVATGKSPPQRMWETLADDSRGEEIPMFRAWYLGMWIGNEASWGPAPR